MIATMTQLKMRLTSCVRASFTLLTSRKDARLTPKDSELNIAAIEGSKKGASEVRCSQLCSPIHGDLWPRTQGVARPCGAAMQKDAEGVLG